jgi:hypothetical protein
MNELQALARRFPGFYFWQPLLLGWPTCFVADWRCGVDNCVPACVLVGDGGW